MYFSLQFYFVANRCLLTLGTFKRNSDIYWRIPCWLGYSRKKSKQGQSSRTGGHFWKNTEIFGFVTLPLEIVNSREKRVHPRKFCKIVVHSFFGLEFSRPKAKTHGNSTWFFLDQLITPRNSTSFLIDPWNFLMLFHFFNIPTPGICMSLIPSVPCLNPLTPSPLFLNFFWNGMHSIAKKQWAKSLQSM